MQIVVADLGVGNLRSVEHALKAVAGDADVLVSASADDLARADRIVLPGQGAVGTWFTALRERNLENALLTALQEKPLLGICVGMQALYNYCDEDGGMPGLGLLNGNVRHFRDLHNAEASGLKIPHMGWNKVSQIHDHPMWHNIEDQAWFYFVHSYCANAGEDADLGEVFGSTDYGHQFISAGGRGQVFAVQFHPEKSHDDGLQLLKNFCNWSGASH